MGVAVEIATSQATRVYLSRKQPQTEEREIQCPEGDVEAVAPLRTSRSKLRKQDLSDRRKSEDDLLPLLVRFCGAYVRMGRERQYCVQDISETDHRR